VTTFCEQKVAKKLLYFGAWDLAASPALGSKVFCFFCEQKKRFLPLLACPPKTPYARSMAVSTIISGLLLRLTRPWA
jgi:hypothetical protein